MLISSSARTVIPLFLAGALLGTPGLSSAAAPRGVTLRYEAPASCPTRQEFHDAVTRRLGHSIDFDDETSGSVASVRIATAAGSATAEVSFESPGVAANLRQFTTNSCGEAVEAAALVVALIIDPTIANAPSSATEPKPTEPGDAPAFRPPTAPKRAPSREARHATAPTDAHSWVAHSRLSFGAVVAPTLGVSPSVLFAGGARFGFDPAPNDRGSWSPHFALSALFARTGLIGAEADFGEITWFTSQLDGCSSKWPLTTTLTFRPCLS
ncbi:MAG TPA: hypothetical protein VFQ35_25600, partial [Polyangiaceae bacterium]|nr:hypothetical protein [Polyangiaceae bacterium]